MPTWAAANTRAATASSSPTPRGSPFPDPRFATLQDALNFAVSQFALNGQVAVEVAGSDTWSMAGPLSVDLPAGTTLELRAADPARPTLLLDGELAITGDASSTFVLNGFVLAAGAAMMPAAPGHRPHSCISRRFDPAAPRTSLASSA